MMADTITEEAAEVALSTSNWNADQAIEILFA
jgi:hypothetical protein